MYRHKAKSIKSLAALALVEDLQSYFVSKLNKIGSSQSGESVFKTVEWFRDQGLHGGGVRYVTNNEAIFNRGSVNVSQVQYEGAPNKSLASATALSTIIHPQNPFAPSVHMHISWTEMKNGMGYWRLMADLNPAIKTEIFKASFDECLKTVAVEQYSLATEQGNHYFFIPALARHRGVSHFYLEGYNGKNTQIDFNLATSLGKAVIDCYVDIFSQALKENPLPNAEYYRQQIEYHTLYLFQVLTLDRGTTSGLLIHSQNDLGIMGSLPAKIDRALLASWKKKLVEPQKQLLADIVNVLPNTSPCCINDTTKLALANVVRQHYQSNPDALSQQAQSKVIADTVNNHR